MKKIGVIGSGIVGQTLANGFVAHGYDVMIGTNTPAKHDELRDKTRGQVAVGSFEETAKFGDILVLATKGTAAESALRAAGLANLANKTVIDTTNPIADAPPINGVLQYFTSQNDSLMERLQALAPQAHFVKAFSCIGNAFMVNPDFRGQKPSMFICGNDAAAKGELSVSSINSDSRLRTWARSRARGPSNRCASSGVFPDFSRTAGHTRSSC